MDPLTLLVLAGAAWLLWSSGALQSIGGPASSPSSSPYLPSSTPPPGLSANVSFSAPNLGGGPGNVTGANTTGLLISGGASVAGAAVSAPASFAALGLTGAAAGAAVAGIGVVVAIAAALWAAHEQRVAQAKSENSAVVIGVQGWDADMLKVNQLYNARQLDAASAIQLVQQIMYQYWQLVTPHIQPGRNGCSGGGGCPPVTSANPCSGSIGAACCVGCYDLAGGPDSHVFTADQGGDGATPFYFGAQGTIIVLQHGSGRVLYQKVFASKYGGRDRAAYILNWAPVSAA